MLNNQLEGVQQAHNRLISDAGNISASNDPNQLGHDINESRKKQLLAGAAKLAAGNTLGLSEEETLALISRETRKQQRADQSITEEDVMRQFAQTKKSMADAPPSELAGIALRREPEVDPFGAMQDDSQSYSREEKVRFGVLPNEMMTDEEIDMRDEAVERPVSGTAGVREALGRLQAAEAREKGLQGMLSRVMGGGIGSEPGVADLVSRLEDRLQYGREQKRAEASLARDAVIQDYKRAGFGFNETAEAKYRQAAAEAQAIAANRFTVGGGGAIADEIMRRIGTANAGPVGDAYFSTQLGSYVDASGTPLAVQPEDVAVSGINAPDTANALNAPQRQTAIDYVAKQLPDFRQGERVFGDYNQTDISGTSQLFAQRVAQSGLFNPDVVKPDVRGIDEFQKAVDAIARLTGDKGTKMYRRELVEDPNTGKARLQSTRVPSDQVGAQEVMNFLRYTPQEQQEFANALYQAEIARGSAINQNAKNTYFGRGAIAPGPKDNVVFSAAEAINPREGAAKIARVAPGQTIEGRDIKSAFKGLNYPGARSNFIGQVEGGNPNLRGSDSDIRYVGRAIAGRPTSEIPAAVREQEMGFARNRAKTAMKKEGAAISPARIERRAEGMMDESKLKDRTVKAQLAQERAIRDNKKRNARQLAIREGINQGKGAPPREPQSAGSSVGYGDQLRQVQQDARDQSADMAFSEKIRRMRAGR